MIEEDIIKDFKNKTAINDQTLNFENKNEFTLLNIRINNLESLKWGDSTYLDDILNLDLFQQVNTNPENFLNDVVKYLDLNDYNENSDLMIETQLISEFPEFIFEMIFINNIKKDDKIKNDLATLLITNGETIYGNVIILKTSLPKDTDNLIFINTEKSDIKTILENRVKTKVVIYDGEWSETIVIGNMEEYAKGFFEDTYLKFEIGFLKHNINIWYEKLDGCSSTICGKILEKPIYKCIWFTMNNDLYRGSISLDEVTKIILLSHKLNEPFTPFPEWISDEKDELGRNKIKNKYRILEKAYKELIIKKISS